MDPCNLRLYREEYRARQRILESYKDELEELKARHRGEIDELYARRDQRLQELTRKERGERLALYKDYTQGVSIVDRG